MNRETHQMNTWSGDFGREYTDRNPHTTAELNELYQKQFGVTRSVMNVEFLDSLNREIRILEVGANVGVQLQALQEMGFHNLYGIELQHYAVEEAKKHTKDINIIQGSAFDIPFREGWFDLVYTSGVLIHINPDDLHHVQGEICRCSSQWIWGFEYYAPVHTEISYRGNANLMWKGDFAARYLAAVPGMENVKEKHYQYVGSENVDAMFLLRKASV